MRASIARFTTAVAVVIAMGAVGCKSTPKTTTETSKTDSEWKEAPTSRESGTGMSGKKLDLTTIYFDFDKYDIRPDQRDAAKANAAKVKGMTGNVVIEGNTDERGSEEYNLALGERRAESVRRYFVDSGVPAGRLSTVSFGESRPAVQGHDESAWKYNRRVDFSAGN
jgi:peptidoglycan-associated lipoprotein